MSDKQNRMVISRITKSTTQTGKPVVYLFGDNLRFKFPEISLFDLSLLLTVGIDPNALEQGEEHWCRFYAHYTESDKVNQNKNPYKDITRLELVDLPGEGDAVVEELRDLHATVAQLSGYVQDLVRSVVDIYATLERPPPTPELVPETAQSTNEASTNEAPPPKQEPPPAGEQPDPVLDEDQARRVFFQEAGSAVNDKIIKPADVKAWKAAVAAKRISWRDALAQLRAIVPKKRAEQKKAA